jgi:hypothetical protein
LVPVPYGACGNIGSVPPLNSDAHAAAGLDDTSITKELWSMKYQVALAAVMLALGSVAAYADDAVSLTNPDQKAWGWTFDNGREFPGATGSLAVDPAVVRDGQACLQLHGDFTAGGNYVQAAKDLRGVDIDELSFWLKGFHREAMTMRLVDASGQCHQFSLKTQATDDWQQITFPLATFFRQAHVHESVTHYESWGGAKDGQWHGPAKLLAILVGPTADQKTITAWIGDPKIYPLLAGAQAGQPAAYSEGFEKLTALPATWKVQGKVSLTQTGAFKGSACLTLDRAAADREQPTSAILNSFPVTAGKWELRAAMKSSLDSPDTSYNGRITLEALNAAGQVLDSIELGVATGTSAWQVYRKTVELPAGAVAARFRVEMNKTVGAFSVDDLSATPQTVAGSAPASVAVLKFGTAALGNLFFPQDHVQFDVSVECLRPLPDSAQEVLCVVKDYWGAEYTDPIRVKLAPAGQTGKGRTLYRGVLDLAPYPLEEGKYYEVHGEVADPATAEPFHDHSSFAILPEAVTKKYKPFEVPFTSRDWDNRIKEYFFLSDRLGIRVCGIWSGWSATPPYTPSAPGIEWCAQLGMGALLGANNWEGGKGAYSETALREGAKNMVNKYKDYVPIVISLGNEPHPANDAQTQEMVAGYKAVYEGVKAADPNVLVIGTSCGLYETFFKAGFGRYQDVYDLHLYEDPKDLVHGLDTYPQFFAKYGNPKPVWATEIGLNSQGLPRLVVTVDMIKKFAIFFAHGGVNISWFDLLYPDPEGKRPGTNSEAFDVFDSRYCLYSPKITAVAYYNLVNAICVKKFVAEQRYGSDIHAYLFRDTEHRCLQVLWKDKGHQESFVPLPGIDAVKLLRIDGSSAALNAHGQGLTLNLAEEPLLLLYDSAAGGLPEKLAPPAIACATPPGQVVCGGSCAFTLALNGVTGDDVTVTAPPHWGVRQTGPATWSLTAPGKTTGREGRVIVSLKNGAGELYFPVPVAGVLQLRLVATPLTGPDTAGVKLLVKNNGRAKQTVNVRIAVAQEFPLAGGSFNFGKPVASKAYVTDGADVTVELDGLQEKSLAAALAGLDPQTLYQVRATVTDSLGKSLTIERFVAGCIHVPHATATLKMDGTLGDPAWQKSTPLPINQARQFYSFNPKRTWGGPADLSGEMRLLWDERYLYVGVKVTDKVFQNDKQDGGLWAGDSLQFMIDPARESPDKPGKYEYTVGVGTKGPQAWCGYSADASAPTGEAKDIVVLNHAAGDGTGGMTYELAIPWSRLAPFTPASGRNLGLAVILNDDNGTGRDCFMGWFSGVHQKELDSLGDLILGD